MKIFVFLIIVAVTFKKSFQLICFSCTGKDCTANKACENKNGIDSCFIKYLYGSISKGCMPKTECDEKPDRVVGYCCTKDFCNDILFEDNSTTSFTSTTALSSTIRTRNVVTQKTTIVAIKSQATQVQTALLQHYTLNQQDNTTYHNGKQDTKSNSFLMIVLTVFVHLYSTQL